MPYIIIKKEIEAEAKAKIKKMKKNYESEKFERKYIQELIGSQKCELDVESRYFKGKNIAEANWSVIEKDEDIENLDREEIEDKLVDICISKLKKDKSDIREKNSEYTYVFMPSYYAVKTLILYYLENRMEAKKIYGLKNAVVRRQEKKFYGGLPFILKYLKKMPKDKSIRFDFAEFMQKLLDCKLRLEINNDKDEFIKNIIDCIKEADCGKLILERRVKDFKDEKDKFYIECKIIGDYKILNHRDVEKDWGHLQKSHIKKANEIIDNTPNFPKNEPPKNDPLHADIKGWFSQRVSKKDRVVYKKDSTEKKVYIATVCDHYKDAERRSRSTKSYR